jgi:MYXO-CTERM domain-containing protein
MRVYLSLLAGIILMATPSRSLACKCAPPPEVADALREASAVFEGRVSKVEAAGDDVEVTLDAVQAWKGVSSEQVRIRTRSSSAACGVDFTPGESYLVYANDTAADGADPALWALRCGRTRLATQASEDYVQLGVGAVPVAARAPETPPEQPAAGERPAATPSGATEPGAGGCASCHAGGAAHDAPGLALLALIGLALAHRRSRA